MHVGVEEPAEEKGAEEGGGDDGGAEDGGAEEEDWEEVGAEEEEDEDETEEVWQKLVVCTPQPAVPAVHMSHENTAEDVNPAGSVFVALIQYLPGG